MNNTTSTPSLRDRLVAEAADLKVEIAELTAEYNLLYAMPVWNYTRMAEVDELTDLSMTRQRQIRWMLTSLPTESK